MASLQRRRGQWALVYRTKVITDSRGNKVEIVDMANPHRVRAAFIPQRSQRAELPGQQDIDIVRMLVDYRLTDVDSWSRVQWDGSMWDVVMPPAMHYGTRHSRHYSMDLRRRPS